MRGKERKDRRGSRVGGEECEARRTVLKGTMSMLKRSTPLARALRCPSLVLGGPSSLSMPKTKETRCEGQIEGTRGAGGVSDAALLKPPHKSVVKVEG